jgi:hypothetical protein
MQPNETANTFKCMYLPKPGSLGNANPVAVIWMLITDQTVSFEAMLRKKPSLIRGVPKPIRRVLRAFTTLQNLIICLEADERPAFTVFAHSNHHAHALNFTPASSWGVCTVYAFLKSVVRNDSQSVPLRDPSMFPQTEDAIQVDRKRSMRVGCTALAHPR